MNHRLDEREAAQARRQILYARLPLYHFGI